MPGRVQVINGLNSVAHGNITNQTAKGNVSGDFNSQRVDGEQFYLSVCSLLAFTLGFFMDYGLSYFFFFNIFFLCELSSNWSQSAGSSPSS